MFVIITRNNNFFVSEIFPPPLLNSSPSVAAEHIKYWRPLIWEIDVALQALPSFTGKTYRGINCQLDLSTCRANDLVMWSARMLLCACALSRWGFCPNNFATPNLKETLCFL